MHRADVERVVKSVCVSGHVEEVSVVSVVLVTLMVAYSRHVRHIGCNSLYIRQKIISASTVVCIKVISEVPNVQEKVVFQALS
jgi:hypothetical protein